VAVGVGIYSYSGGGKTQTEIAGPKHELLARGVDFVADMSTAKTSQDRTKASLVMAGNLRAEMKDLYQHAQPDDLATLAEMYHRVVTKGLVAQSKQMRIQRVSVEERHALWLQARDQLKDVVQDVTGMQATSSRPGVAASLTLMKTTAQEGQVEIQKLIDGA
jgi:hypothetical protein